MPQIWVLFLLMSAMAGDPQIQSRSDPIAARFNKAVQLQRQGAWKEAEAEYRALLVVAPRHAEAWANLGAVLMRVDRYAEAVACYESALRANPKLTPVLLNLGIAHFRKGAFAKSAVALKRYLDASPDNARATLLLGLSLVELGRDAEAVEGLKRHFDQVHREIEAAARENPNQPHLQYLLGLVYLNQGRLKEAKRAFEAELVRTSGDSSSLYYLASIDRSDGKLLDARGKLERALATEPSSEPAKALLAKVLDESKTLRPDKQNAYVGARKCAECHPAQARKQNASSMANAAFPPGEHPLKQRFLRQTADVQGMTFRLEGEAEPFRISITDGKRQYQLPVEWALGSGVLGVSFYTRLEPGKYLKVLFTYFSQVDRLDFTPGQREHAFRVPAEAAGMVNNRDEAFRCIGCHSTGTANRSDRDDILVGELGVRCEACHGPGLLHREAVMEQNVDEARKLIVNPRSYGPRQMLNLCGTCHIEPPANPASVNWKDPENARFQPVGLSQSQCFQKGGLSCVPCHDAHADAHRADPTYYSGVCLSCHNSSASRPARVCSGQEPTDCVRCHMPKVQPFKHLEFSNHWIGRYAEGRKLVPTRRDAH